MSQDTENFEQLRRLLALKRHEQPPPGYFNDFSRQVIVRIKAGERGQEGNFLERLTWEAPWLQRLWSAFEARPILAGACGVAVCGLMITGVLYSDRADVSPVALVPVADYGTPPGALTSISPSEQPFLATPAMLVDPTSPRPMLTGSPANGSLLGDIKQLQADRASFTFPAGN
jgi:hypothetical protein